MIKGNHQINQWGDGTYSVSVLGKTGEESVIKEEIKMLIYTFDQNKL